VSKRAATPVRFDPAVADRLSSFAAANPGMSLSSAANRLVDEALRTSEHPGIMFRPGPTGRRAGLAGGPDVWEIVRAIRSGRPGPAAAGRDLEFQSPGRFSSLQDLLGLGELGEMGRPIKAPRLGRSLGRR
jgi:hypothetical protein